MLDEIDRRILRELQLDGRASFRDLGRRVGLSPNATGVRVGRLLADGVITGIHAQIDHAQLGRSLDAYVDCWLIDRDERAWETFERHVVGEDRILEAVHITGKVDFRLRVVVASPADLEDLLRGLKRYAGVAETDTRLVLRRSPVASDP